MPREEYSITADDEIHATFYLGDRIRNRDLRFQDSDFYTSAESDFGTAIDEKTTHARIAALKVCPEILEAKSLVLQALADRRHRTISR